MTFSPRKVVSILTAAIALSLPVALSSYAADKGDHAHDSAKGQASGPSMQMHQSMMKGMKQMQGMKPSGNMDHDFAMMMRHHHTQGVEMAQYELKHGSDPKMKDMAQKILDSQQKEIAEFDEWMKSHGGAKK